MKGSVILKKSKGNARRRKQTIDDVETKGTWRGKTCSQGHLTLLFLIKQKQRKGEKKKTLIKVEDKAKDTCKVKKEEEEKRGNKRES